MPDIHPSEFGYAFAFAKTEEIIGWGAEPFRPAGAGDGELADWLTEGEKRLVAAGRLVGAPETGLNFIDDIAQAILALVNPGIVLLAQRKSGSGVRTQTVHVRGDDLVGLTRHPDGTFDLTRYADLPAAAGACAAFVGAALPPLDTEARIETDREALSALRRLAGNGQADQVVTALMQMGVGEPDARSATLALASPTAAGVASVLYCRNNVVEDTESFSAMTNAQDHTWIVFAPASLNGPMILERSSVAALTARIAVGIAARLMPPN